MRSFRKLMDHEKSLLGDHLVRVSGEDRVMRFMGGVNDDFIRTHSSQLGWPKSMAIGCFVDGTLRGASELWFAPSDQKSCELALTVERAHQGEGIGTELLRRSLVMARNRGARSVYFACLPQNSKMQHILRKFGRTVTTDADGTIESELAISGPTHVTLWQEFAGEGLAMMDSFVERMSRPAKAA